MEIQTNISIQDIIDFNLFHFKSSPAMRRYHWIISIPCLLFSLFWLKGALHEEDPIKAIKTLLPLIIAGPTVLIMLPIMMPWQIKRQLKRMLAEGNNKGMVGAHKIILTSEGVTDIGEFSQATTQWKAIEKIVTSKTCLYIYTSSVSSQIVPGRFFSTPTAFEEFVAKAKELHQLAIKK